MPGRRASARVRADELLLEPVVDLVGHEHPLHRDAELAGVGEAGADRALGRPVQVGVAQHQDRVLAAQLQRAADQPVGALLGDQLAGRGGAGEADVVGALDDRAAELATRTGDDVPEVLGEAGLLEQLRAEQRGQHGLGVRLGDHGVAGQQRRDAVAQGQRERVVPGRDDADDALGHVVDLDPGQDRDRAQLALGVEVAVGRTCVVAGREGDVHRLVVGVLAGLAGLPADEVHDLVLAVHHDVVQPQQDLRTVLQRGLCPRPLGPPCSGDRVLDVGGARLGDHRQRLAGERGVRRHLVARCRHHPAGQRADVGRVQRVRRRGVVLGIGRARLAACGGSGRIGLKAHARTLDSPPT